MILFNKKSKENTDQEEEYPELHPCFQVPPPMPGEDLSAPPMTGEQFLRKTIEEAKKLKSVLLANVETFQKSGKRDEILQLPEKAECKIDLLNSKNWQLSTVANFSQLRMNVESLRNKMPNDYSLSKIKRRLPSKYNDEKWLKICLQRDPDIVESSAGPSTKLCLALTQGQICCLLSYFSDWFSNGAIGIQDGSRWVYCLLACIDTPVPPDIQFVLRQIVRFLVTYRAQLENRESNELYPINLLVCIIGRYFRQLDLADPFI